MCSNISTESKTTQDVSFSLMQYFGFQKTTSHWCNSLKGGQVDMLTIYHTGPDGQSGSEKGSH